MSAPDACSECGFVYDVPRAEIAPRLRGLGPRYAAVLRAHDPSELRAYSTPGVWSPLEYCCHMRDVLLVQRERTRLAMEQDEPTFASMRREERVVEERYNEQDPQHVAREITDTADALAATLEALGETAWLRTGVYSYPTKRVRNVEWIGNHTIHEGEHHLLDIARQLDH